MSNDLTIVDVMRRYMLSGPHGAHAAEIILGLERQCAATGAVTRELMFAMTMECGSDVVDAAFARAREALTADPVAPLGATIATLTRERDEARAETEHQRERAEALWEQLRVRGEDNESLRSTLDLRTQTMRDINAALVEAQTRAETASEALAAIERHAEEQDRTAWEKRADAPCSADAHHNAASAIFRALDVVLRDGKRRWAESIGRWYGDDAAAKRDGAG